MASLAHPGAALASSSATRGPAQFAPGSGPPPGRNTTTATQPAPTTNSEAPVAAPVSITTTTTNPAQLVISTPHDFAIALLYALGDPLTPQNVGAVVSWEKAEGGAWNSPAKYNPLNTTRRMLGSRSVTAVGVQAYTSWPQGLLATVQTLQGGAYRNILVALKTGTSEQAVERAVASSIWGTGTFSLLP